MSPSPFVKEISPDWESLIRCVARKGTPERVHPLELFLDHEIKQAIWDRYDLLAGINEDDPYFVPKAEIAIPAYLEGSYQTQRKSLERGLTIAKTNLETAEKMLANSRKLFKRGYVTELEVEGNAFTVTQAKLELGVAQTELEVFNKYTKEMQLETLNGNLTASKSKLEADKAGLAMDKARLDRA